MPPKSFYYSSDYWSARAEEARVLAERMSDDWTRTMMLGVAADYDRYAERAKHRADARLSSVEKHPFR